MVSAGCLGAKKKFRTLWQFSFFKIETVFTFYADFCSFPAV
jgi:hypothetical protein